VLSASTNLQALIDEARAAPDWPADRPIEIVGGATLAADESDDRFVERIEELASWGVTYARLTFPDLERQTDFASKLATMSMSANAITSSAVKPGATSSSTNRP
jgi:hypothetical protein